jgi:hypothetical protein
VNRTRRLEAGVGQGGVPQPGFRISRKVRSLTQTNAIR